MQLVEIETRLSQIQTDKMINDIESLQLEDQKDYIGSVLEKKDYNIQEEL